MRALLSLRSHSAATLGTPMDAGAAQAAVPPLAREVVDELARLLGNQKYFAGSSLSHPASGPPLHCASISL